MTLRYPDRPGLDVRVDGGVLRLTLARPDKHNALSDDMIGGLIEALEAAELDDRVRVVVLGGRGGHFCAGFDIVSRNEGVTGRPRVGSIQRRLPSTAHRLIPRIMTAGVPVVCRAQGWIAGIGLHLVVAADVAVVAEDARLWEPFSARGLTADSGSSWLLPRRIGEVRAREMLVLGRPVSGSDAQEWGLVHRAVPASALEVAADELAAALAARPKEETADAKRLLFVDAQGGMESANWATTFAGARACVGAAE